MYDERAAATLVGCIGAHLPGLRDARLRGGVQRDEVEHVARGVVEEFHPIPLWA